MSNDPTFQGFLCGIPIFTKEGVDGVEIVPRPQVPLMQQLEAYRKMLSRLHEEAQHLLLTLQEDSLPKGEYPHLAQVVKEADQLLKLLMK